MGTAAGEFERMATAEAAAGARHHDDTTIET
jgi:hypothetical protein